MRLFQYWDGLEPPEEVAGWIEGFRRNNPDFEHVLYNEKTAREFIAQHYSTVEVAAFDACLMPAMQSDYVRLCLLNKFGGVYVDADNQSREPLSGFFSDIPSALILTWHNLLANGFLMFREPENPFIRACLTLATENVSQRRFNVAMTATGPAVLSAVRGLVHPDTISGVVATFDNPFCSAWGFLELVEHARALIRCSDELVEACEAMTLKDTFAATRWLGFDEPAYKKTDRHWLNWKGPIYR